VVSHTEEPQRRERPHAEELTAALTLAREQLEMDVAFLGEVEDGREVVRTSSGDADSFGLAQGTSVDLSATYCQHVLEGRLDGAVPDATREPLTAGLEITARASIGSYIGVPLRARNARLYMLCCLAHESRPALGEADLRFMRGVGETVLAAVARKG
jgi:GAF domain-containing protein